MPSSPTYYELLKHPLWQRKRLEILQRAEFSCENCGAREKTLHVHHTYYEKGLKPWEYPRESLRCLCEDCHSEATDLNVALQREIGKLSGADLEALLGYAIGMNAREDPGRIIELHSAETIDGIADAWGIDGEDVIEHALNKGAIDGQTLERIQLALKRDPVSRARARRERCRIES